MRGLTTQVLLRYADRRRDQGAGPATIGQDITYLHTVLKSGGAILDVSVRGAIERLGKARSQLNRSLKIARPAERNRRPTREEHQALLHYFKHNLRQRVPMADIWLFACASAMRLSEITRLTWGDYDASRRLIIIRARKHPDPSKKQANDQTIPLLLNNGIDPAAVIARQPRGSIDPNARIFPYNPHSVSTMFTRACRRLDIEDLRFHDGRHHAVSAMFEAGYRIEQVALVSGHKDWSMLRRYTQIDPETLHDHASQPLKVVQ